MKLVLRIIFACALAGTASAAAAQTPAGRNYGRPVDSPETRANRALRGSTRCALGDAPSSVRKVLETAIGSDDEAKRVKSLIGVARNCYRADWPPFPATAVRNVIAEFFYLDQYRRDAPDLTKVLASPPESFAIVPAGSKGKPEPEQELAWYLAAVANCAVFAGSGPARELIVGPTDVAEEVRRFDALRPAIRRCLPAGGDAQLTPRVFRGFVAQALLTQAETAKRRP